MSEMTFADYMEQHNPFGMKDSNNEILYFASYESAYAYVMKLLREQHPRGYIDMILFLVEHCGMDKVCAEDYWRAMRKVDFDTFESEVILIDWLIPQKEKDRVMNILKGLHQITETPFSLAQFEKAWAEFIENFKPVSMKEFERHK